MSSKKSPKKLIIIDGNAIIHRSYHALPPLTTKKGELVNAVYGFTMTMLNVISKFKPDYIIATFDLAGPTFRHEEYKEYKATRVKAPDELYGQIERVKELVRAFNIPIYEHLGYEADDVIGTVVRLSEECPNPIENIIVTGDLDTLQLVSDKTKVYTMRRGITDSVLYDKEKIIERYGLSPEQMTDYKGLRGDASDNIPGVKGIGEKTATELLQKYGTLENVYKNLSEIKSSIKEKLERDKMQAIQSKKLGSIHKNVPIDLDFSEIKVHAIDRDKLVELFKELEFFSLIKRIPGNDTNTRMPASPASGDANSANMQMISENRDKPEFKVSLVGENKIDELIPKLKKQKEIALSLRTVGFKYYDSELKGISFSLANGECFYVEYSKDNFDKLKSILENSSLQKIGYDLKYDCEVLKKFGVNLEGVDFDVMLAAYVLNPGGKIDLETLVLSELGEEFEESPKKGQLGLDIDSPLQVAEKLCRVAGYVYQLKKIYKQQIATISSEQKGKYNLESVFRDLEMPLVEVLASMEINGVKLNPVILEGISEKISKRIINLEKGIYTLAGTEFNINSPRQLAEILFSKLKISTEDIKKGKTGYSTASTELQKIRSKHKIIERIEEYRELFKLKTTYLDPLPTLADKESRIHTSYNQAVTATGRLSSSDPNLQNIPIRGDIGQLIRTAFEASEGHKLISADYSQIDLRVMAHVSGDKKLIELFYQGEDIHRATAALINNVSLSAVTDRMRRGAKELNFGVIYGISPFGFAMRSGVDRDQAKKFIDEYFEKFPAVAKYMKETKEFTEKYGFTETELGRRRIIPEVHSPNFQVRAAGERMAINMPIQGLSADIMKLAMIKLYEEFKDNPSIRMILQVHDEIIWEVKENLVPELMPKIKEIMESVYKLKVPLIADVKVGDNWGEI